MVTQHASDDTPHVESPMDYEQHHRTYSGFLNVTKWVIGATAVSMIVLFFLINP